MMWWEWDFGGVHWWTGLRGFVVVNIEVVITIVPSLWLLVLASGKANLRLVYITRLYCISLCAVNLIVFALGGSVYKDIHFAHSHFMRKS